MKPPRLSASILAALSFAVASCPAAEPSPGIFVAVGYGGRRMASHDGENWIADQRWSDEAKDDDNVLFNIAFGLGRFIAVGGGAKTGHILSTRDGESWTELPQVRGRVATIAFGNGRFVAGHDAELLLSTDGETFSAGGKMAVRGSVHARRSAFGSGEGGARFVIIGDVDLYAEKKRVSWRASTEDGTHFTSEQIDTPAARDVAYGAGHFVVVGPDGLIESSHDGLAWERHATAPGEDFSRVIWTGERFIVSGGKSGWSSPDGLAWSSDVARIPCSVAWAGEGALEIGFSWGGNIHVSSDLVHWRKLNVPSGPSLESIAFGRAE